AKEGDDLLIVGATFPELGGSEYYESVQRLVGGRVPKVNLKIERQLLRTVTKVIESGVVEAAHDISKGGLAVSLAEMAIQGQKGFTVNLDNGICHVNIENRPNRKKREPKSEDF